MKQKQGPKMSLQTRAKVKIEGCWFWSSKFYIYMASKRAKIHFWYQFSRSDWICKSIRSFYISHWWQGRNGNRAIHYRGSFIWRIRHEGQILWWSRYWIEINTNANGYKLDVGKTYIFVSHIFRERTDRNIAQRSKSRNVWALLWGFDTKPVQKNRSSQGIHSAKNATRPSSMLYYH